MNDCIGLFYHTKEKNIDALLHVTDMRIPHEWYESARRMRRTIYFHAGPTNSGKTHTALERFRNSASGLYCAPLRLLALEVFEKTNAANIPCDLFTGEERRVGAGVEVDYNDTTDLVVPQNSPPAAPNELWPGSNSPYSAPSAPSPSAHVSCTIEMANINRRWDVAVIDEIQMISDETRGAAWTRALLGLCAKEIHLCGEKRALDIVQKILQPINETVVLQEYQRLTSLLFATHSLNGYLDNVKPGDALIAFNRKYLFALKANIERVTPYRCAVVYGSLPAATRSRQAKLFNSQSEGYQILLATDAVGMGLNLNIGRIVLTSSTKYDGKVNRTLTSSEVRQIAGRAGRFNSRFSNGVVTT